MRISRLLGGFIGAITAFILRAVGGGVEDLDLVEKQTGVLVYTVIEILRKIRTALHFDMMEAKNDIIMIAGLSPSVSKSIVSDNF